MRKVLWRLCRYCHEKCCGDYENEQKIAGTLPALPYFWGMCYGDTGSVGMWKMLWRVCMSVLPREMLRRLSALTKICENAANASVRDVVLETQSVLACGNCNVETLIAFMRVVNEGKQTKPVLAWGDTKTAINWQQEEEVNQIGIELHTSSVENEWTVWP